MPLRNIIWAMYYIVCLFIIGCTATLPESVRDWKLVKQPNDAVTFGNGDISRQDDFFILQVRGIPYEMGYQQGVLLKEDIQKFADDSWASIDTEYLKGYLFFIKWIMHYKARSIASEYLPYIPQEYLDEMRGIADGSGISFDDVLLANISLEANAEIQKRYLCTSMVLKDEITPDGSLYHAYNIDTYLPLNGTNYIDPYKGLTFYQPKNKNSFVSMTTCGFASVVTGMNNKGITVSLNCPNSQRVQYGMPMRFLLRRVMENADNLSEALGILKAATLTIEGSITISDGHNNKSASVFFTPGGISCDTIYLIERDDSGKEIKRTVTPIKNVTKPNFSISLQEVNATMTGNGTTEWQEVFSQLKKKNTPRDIQEVLRYKPDDFLPIGICSKQTSYSIIYHPATLSFWAALGKTPAPLGIYHTFELKDNLTQQDKK